MTPLRLFRFAAIAEAVTWTLLLAGLVLRATLGLDLAVTVGGGIHGFVFLAFAAVAVLVSINQRWSFVVTVLAVGSAVVPYATIPVELWLGRTGRLSGAWRLEQTADPRDARWFDRAARALFRRPRVLAAVIAVGVIALFLTLLVAGPPGGENAA